MFNNIQDFHHNLLNRNSFYYISFKQWVKPTALHFSHACVFHCVALGQSQLTEDRKTYKSSKNAHTFLSLKYRNSKSTVLHCIFNPDCPHSSQSDQLKRGWGNPNPPGSQSCNLCYIVVAKNLLNPSFWMWRETFSYLFPVPGSACVDITLHSRNMICFINLMHSYSRVKVYIACSQGDNKITPTAVNKVSHWGKWGW